MTLHEQGFDSLAILACLQFTISQTLFDVHGGVEISVHPLSTGPATKRLLIEPILSVHIIAHTTLL
jgi:hypothetical protein